MYSRVLRHVVRRPVFTNSCLWSQGQKYYSTEPRPAPKTSKPLRILFCGSDDFSSASLRAIVEQQKQNPELIASIDVVCRTGKPSGRDLKVIREVPIKAVAQELGLPIHEISTFTKWEIPREYEDPINLIICVSFGLFVPPRILSSVEYGGLNVHPSILPDFRGPAPLQHIIMTGRRYTGVTLQTLDHDEFDKGKILLQTPRNGVRVPKGGKCTYDQLLSFVTPLAADILVSGLKDRVFVEPHTDVGWLSKKKKSLVRAGKITSADKRVNWRDHNGIEIERHFRALGRMWTLAFQDQDKSRRVVLEDMELVPKPDLVQTMLKRFAEKRNGPLTPTDEEQEKIHFAVVEDRGYRKPRYYVVDDGAVIFYCSDEGIRVKQITLEGRGKQSAATAMKSFQDWKSWKLRTSNGHPHCLHKAENWSALKQRPLLSAEVVDRGGNSHKTNLSGETVNGSTR